MDKVKLNEAGVLERTAKILEKGGVVMHPTETCYGFAVDVFNEQAIEKLYKLKGRDANKPVSILVSDIEMAKKYGEFSPSALKLAAAYWPGPLSIVVPRKEALSKCLNPGERFISMRVSDDLFCRNLPKALGRPVTTTSANLAGEPPLYTPKVDVFGELKENIDLLVDGGVLEERKPSTIVKIDENDLVILRQGDLMVNTKITQ